MKKAELIEYIKKLQEENSNKSVEIISLLGEIALAESRIGELEEIKIKKNDRGAGRKEKFNKEQIKQILEARKQGKSIRVIAKEFDCSSGLIHKILNEKKREI